MKRYSAVLLGVLVFLSLSTHLLPLSQSQYPFNNDGLTECSTAQEIIQTGRIILPSLDESEVTHTESTPFFNILIAYVASVFEMDPMSVGQLVVAAVSCVTVTFIFLIIRVFSGNREAAFIGGMFASLYGTFVFLTASVWKESLGVAFYVMLMLCYSRRSDRRLFALEILILLTVPFVHHLTAFVSYASIGYLTAWSLVFGFHRRSVSRRHLRDTLVILAAIGMSLLYYVQVSYSRLSYVQSISGIAGLLLGFGVLTVLSSLVLVKRKHWSGTFAPVPAVVVAIIVIFFVWNPDLPYNPGRLSLSYYILIFSSAGVFSFAWFGFEKSVESGSKYRAIPIAMFLPILTLIVFAVIAAPTINEQQLLYRGFDSADPAIAVGIGFAFASVLERRRFVRVLIPLFVVLLLVTLPYGVYSKNLLGISHETHEYEVDAFDWLVSSDHAEGYGIQSDERMSYIGFALFGIGKDNRLPGHLVGNVSLEGKTFYIYEEDWSVYGVNDISLGILQPSSHFVGELLFVEDAIYVSGSQSSQLIIFLKSEIGEEMCNWTSTL